MRKIKRNPARVKETEEVFSCVWEEFLPHKPLKRSLRSLCPLDRRSLKRMLRNLLSPCPPEMLWPEDQ